MEESVVITGLGVVCPIGVGGDEVWASVEAGRSGVTRIDNLAAAGWPAPFGGVVTDFDAKRFIKPRKSLKVMAEEIQFAFAAAEQAWEDAGLEGVDTDPERVGVVFGAGMMYSDTTELEGAFAASRGADGRFSYGEWGDHGMAELFPLWMLKHLPNMPACHVGIRRDARGPNNTIATGDTSSLLALAEAASLIRRGQADIVVTGGTGKRMYLSDPLWAEGDAFWQTGDAPATACRPFDTGRLGPVCGEGAGVLVLESRRHALRRGARPIAEVLATAVRSEPCLTANGFTGASIAGAAAAAIDRAGVGLESLGSVNAHGQSAPRDDSLEARALAEAIGDTPVTAPKSFFGNLGAAGGAVELIVSLLGMQRGIVPPTINHHETDADCPVRVVTEPTPTDRPACLAVNFSRSGQAAAAVVQACG